MATGQQIINNFELQVDDTTELSSTEELALLNKVYQDVYSELPWEILKTEFSGTTSTTVPYVALPSDFQYLTVNSNYTTSAEPSFRPVVFVGESYSQYQVVSYSDRRQYRNQDGYCYIDIANMRLVFTSQPTAAVPIEFDYIKVPEALTLATSPIFPERFHDMFQYAMAVEDSIIQQSDKAKSYKSENDKKYTETLNAMKYWNSNLIQM